ncbi:MAG TPA: DnaJ domain-containing protein [Allosphingosinicella sp.]|nr:DnaJ domain-containing protein [Allosphingosinicella sp.]
MPMPRNLYDVLNVSSEAEPVVIEAAYKALMKRYHPDQAEGSSPSKDAAAINEAFATLKDPARRGEYDRRLWKRQQQARLAELQALEPRSGGSRLFGWGGWLVAIALGVAFYSLASGRIAPPVTSAQRLAAEKARLSPAEAAAKRTAAAENDDYVVHPSGAAVVAVARAEAGAAPVAERARSGPRASGSVALNLRPRRAERPPRAKAAATRQEQDFVQRQGGIY